MGKLSAERATGSEVLRAIIDQFNSGSYGTTGDVYIGQALADEFAKYDYSDGLEEVVTVLLDKQGIPDPMHNVFAESDRADLLERLIKAAARRSANMPVGKALDAFVQAKQAAEAEPADISANSVEEIYRLAIRGKIPQIAAIGWCFDDERTGGATEDELAWYCGYVGHDGRLMRELYVPDHVFAGWFPEYRKITWNDYEPKDYFKLPHNANA
jgi:hypothetical protein